MEYLYDINHKISRKEFEDKYIDDPELIYSEEFRKDLYAIRIAMFRSYYYVLNQYPLIKQSISDNHVSFMGAFPESLYMYFNNIPSTPLCAHCGVNPIKFNASDGFGKTCSCKCRSQLEDYIQSIKDTTFKNFGVYNPMQSEVVKQICKDNNMKKYGVPYTLQVQEFKDKSKATCIEKYGVDNIRKADVFKEYLKYYNMEKYGVENPMQSEDIKTIHLQSVFKSYGVTNVGLVPEFRQKQEQTNLSRYGFIQASKNRTVRDKISKSNADFYQKHRIDDDYEGVLYMLYFKDHDSIKIGVSSRFEHRAKQLEKDFGKFDIIKIIETEAIFTLERYFHNKFKEYRICLESGGGRTEFFTMDILELLED